MKRLVDELPPLAPFCLPLSSAATFKQLLISPYCPYSVSVLVENMPMHTHAPSKAINPVRAPSPYQGQALSTHRRTNVHTNTLMQLAHRHTNATCTRTHKCTMRTRRSSGNIAKRPIFCRIQKSGWPSPYTHTHEAEAACSDSAKRSQATDSKQPTHE